MGNGDNKNNTGGGSTAIAPLETKEMTAGSGVNSEFKNNEGLFHFVRI